MISIFKRDKDMKKLAFILFAFVFFSSGYASPAYSKKGLSETKSFLTDVRINSDEKDLLVVVAQFNNDLNPKNNKTKIAVYGTSLNIKLENIYMNSSKRLYKIEDTLLSRIFVYPNNKNELIFNISLLKEIQEKDISLSLDKNRLILKMRKTAQKKDTGTKKNSESDTVHTDPVSQKVNLSENNKNRKREKSDKEVTENKPGQAKDNPIKEASLPVLSTDGPEDVLKEISITSEKELIDSIVNTNTDKGKGVQGETAVKKENKSDDYSNIGLPILFENKKEEGGLRSIAGEVNEKTLLHSEESSFPDIFSSSVKMFVGLSIILSIILLLSYFFKRYFLKNSNLLWKNRLVRVISTNHIGGKRDIALVQVGEELLLLGLSPHNISMLTKIEDKEIRDRIMGKKSNENSFSKELGRYYRQFDKERKLNNVNHITDDIRSKVKGLKRF